MNKIIDKAEDSDFSIPVWMTKENDYSATNKKCLKNKFLGRILKSLSMVMQNEIYSERFVQRKGFLQIIDPRVKLLTFILYMIVCSLARGLLTLIFLAFVPLLYAVLSGLNIKDFIRRVWLILPVFVLVLSIPAATSIFIKGKPLFYLYNGAPADLIFITIPGKIYFSQEGSAAVVKMAVRIGASISFGYLLIMTTRWTELTKSLGVLKIPFIIITILNMTYKYIFILVRISYEMMEARFLREVGDIDNRKNRGFIANRISFLFIKSSYLSEEIYYAMKSRGYTGEPVCLRAFEFKSTDILWVVSNASIVLFLLIGELLL
ncbi:MAG: cobalt ECF transporter T component CbiQ [Caulobacteraceae bacterium]